MEKNKKLLIAVCGTFICYFYFGIIQEKITRAKYVTEEGESETFTYALSLVTMLCVMNFVFAKLISLFFHQEDKTPTPYYMANAMTYVLAMTCTNMALQFVNYPTQVIAKTCKPIPVMILGVWLGNKTYTYKKYCFVFMIVVGVALFMYKDKKSNTESTDFGFGETLLILSLLMDGINGAIQERMVAGWQTKFVPLMLNINMWASLYLTTGVIVSGEIVQFISFVQRFPSVLWQLLTLSVAGCLGQLFIFITISEFGPLPSSIVTTVRKFFTVLFSVIFFGNSLVLRQWLATAIVFGGLTLDVMYGKSPTRQK